MSFHSQIKNGVKAIPTTYSGVNFRSRLEARWAAFFDLADWDWVYEPIDLSGWCPDFSLKCSKGIIYIEVKPVDIEPQDYSAFSKVEPHIKNHIVMLCGLMPFSVSDHFNSPGKIITPNWRDQPHVEHEMSCGPFNSMWADAGNQVQWSAPPKPTTRAWRDAPAARDCWRAPSRDFRGA